MLSFRLGCREVFNPNKDGLFEGSFFCGGQLDALFLPISGRTNPAAI